MKQLPVAGKVLTLIFAAVFLVACSSNDTKEADAAAARAAAEQAAAAAAAQSAQDAANTAASSELRRLQDAAASAGNVFYFAYDSATLTAAARAALDAHIALLGTNDRSVRLEGHTDERGSREYNIALGESRAKTVSRMLQLQGVSSAQVRTVSYGEELPVDDAHNNDAWAKNRRVNVIYEAVVQN